MAGPTPARPTAITIIAVLALIGGIFLIWAGLILLLGGALATAVGGAALGGLVFLWALIVLAEGVAYVGVAYGFWTLKTWAWRLGVILAFASVILSLVGTLFRGFDLGNLIVAIVIAAIWIYYLNLPSIRTAFNAPASGLPVVGNALEPYLSRIKI